MASDLASLREFLHRERDSVADGHVAPDTLYHYTRAAALHSILLHRELWAFNITYMNDGTEFGYAIGRLRDEFAKSGGDLDLELEVLDDLKVNPLSFHEPHISCFCENGDLLSQWRAYGDRDGAFSLGLRTSKLPLRS